MRASIGTRHVRVGGHVPGPISIAGGILSLPIYALTAVIALLGIALLIIGFLGKVLWWLLKVLYWIVIGITAPIWAPIRGWWRHHNKVLVRKVERRQRKTAGKTTFAPPTGLRVR